MKVLAFANTLPQKILRQGSPSNHKLQTLKLFVQGVTANGDHGELFTHHGFEACDVAMMLGWVHENGKIAPHLQLRKQIVEAQRAQLRRTVIADSSLFLYADHANRLNYLRYSYDGIFPDSGYYCNDIADPRRWQKISQNLDIHIKPWRATGDHILMCLQRQGGWSMSGHAVQDWAMVTARQLRQHSDRCLVLRAHPGDRDAVSYIPKIIELLKQHRIQNVVASSPSTSLLQDLRGAWAMVGHNSSPAVAAAIEGIPVFQTDPVRSHATTVASANLSEIEQPVMPDRQAWIERLAQCHWSHAELASGECWHHMRQWASVPR